MPPRLFIDPQQAALATGLLRLPLAAARHARVLRLRAGDALTLFDGNGGEWTGEYLGDDQVRLSAHQPIEREALAAVWLAVGMPANERMDALVEKATELGAAGIQPLLTRRSVLRLQGERAARRVAHWRGVAIAACEQCGRNRVPALAPVLGLDEWLRELGAATPGSERWVLSPTAANALPTLPAGHSAWIVSGPEGGLDEAEVVQLQAAGFGAVQLGPRVLRADTAPLAALMRALG